MSIPSPVFPLFSYTTPSKLYLPTTHEKVGAIFGEKCVRVVDAVPTGAGTNTAAAATASSAWFRDVVHLPDMDDRVWDARLVDSREGQGAGGTEFPSSVLPTGETQRPERVKQAPCQDGESAEDGRRRGRRAGMGLLAVALAHNLVEVNVLRCPHVSTFGQGM